MSIGLRTRGFAMKLGLETAGKTIMQIADELDRLLDQPDFIKIERVVIKMRYIEGIRATEIAKKLDFSESHEYLTRCKALAYIKKTIEASQYSSDI